MENQKARGDDHPRGAAKGGTKKSTGVPLEPSWADERFVLGGHCAFTSCVEDSDSSVDYLGMFACYFRVDVMSGNAGPTKRAI